ncbi:50S ribosomal protein L24 [Aquifex aeolicus]|uniref:Large ribosomal subunit protein uL24 n=1 Tax=Aquifex aeolicus (strain VF5) TaxID=224324 RepID=RL24_AQUAE|nr:50S ribosomal protein L24 [Aquifex aeolicus]O67569.1 RecName: Full=Large ribosomal subunit protein uL24; AltName: Full=50S ribosomal protein L24 [Aquifex aeolicus VF5]AAC07534.1 ribosomal protein L24 [Aquifex aeolicus VF5]
MAAAKIKKGDTVLVVRGKEKGKQGKVLKVYERVKRRDKQGNPVYVRHFVIVEGVRLIKKHVKPIEGVREGGIIETEGPIDISNVMLICPNCNKPTRVGFRIVEEGNVRRKYRYCKKCNENIDLVSEKVIKGG